MPASFAAWANVRVRNCIGPRAPAAFGAQPPAFRPWFVSTRPTAASTSQSSPNRAAACWYRARYAGGMSATAAASAPFGATATDQLPASTPTDAARNRTGSPSSDQGAAAAGARDPHEVSGGADLSGFDGPSRSAARVVSAAYSRSATTASNAVWLRPTNSRPSPGRAWSSERRSAGVRSK